MRALAGQPAAGTSLGAPSARRPPPQPHKPAQSSPRSGPGALTCGRPVPLPGCAGRATGTRPERRCRVGDRPPRRRRRHVGPLQRGRRSRQLPRGATRDQTARELGGGRGLGRNRKVSVRGWGPDSSRSAVALETGCWAGPCRTSHCHSNTRTAIRVPHPSSGFCVPVPRSGPCVLNGIPRPGTMAPRILPSRCRAGQTSRERGSPAFPLSSETRRARQESWHLRADPRPDHVGGSGLLQVRCPVLFVCLTLNTTRTGIGATSRSASPLSTASESGEGPLRNSPPQKGKKLAKLSNSFNRMLGIKQRFLAYLRVFKKTGDHQ
jgi:hypothetical protein